MYFTNLKSEIHRLWAIDAFEIELLAICHPTTHDDIREIVDEMRKEIRTTIVRLTDDSALEDLKRKLTS